MSQSHSPIRAPVCSSATAIFAAMVDLPTPPLPLATAMMWRTPGIRCATTPAPAGGAWMSIKIFALRTPGRSRNTFSPSFLIAAGIFGSFVASASCTFTSPLSILIDLSNPNETMSRVKPGYFTVFNASRTCCSEIDITQTYPPAPGRKPPCALRSAGRMRNLEFGGERDIFEWSSAMNIPKRVIDCLEQNKIRYEVLKHTEAVTAQRIAQAEHVKGRHHAKVVMVKAGAQHVMAVVPADHQIDLEKASNARSEEHTSE